MPFGRAGKNLEIDLSTGNVEKTDIDPKFHETYLGGRGISTKVFWDRVPPETHPFSEKNLLIFGVDSLTGTTAPSANRTAVITRSPQTNLLNYCTLGGFWGAELKQAGYDNLVTIPVQIMARVGDRGPLSGFKASASSVLVKT